MGRTFTVAAKFLRDEASEAIRSCFMPFAGVYAAIGGKDVRVVSTGDAQPSDVKTNDVKKGPGGSRGKSASR